MFLFFSFLPKGTAPADSDTLLGLPAHGQVWEAMVRRADVKEEDLLQLHPPPSAPRESGHHHHHQASDQQQPSPPPLSLRVDRVHGSWIEEDEDDGIEADLIFEADTSEQDDDGGDCRLAVPMRTLAAAFEDYGEVPIPPYAISIYWVSTENVLENTDVLRPFPVECSDPNCSLGSAACYVYLC